MIMYLLTAERKEYLIVLFIWTGLNWVGFGFISNLDGVWYGMKLFFWCLVNIVHIKRGEVFKSFFQANGMVWVRRPRCDSRFGTRWSSSVLSAIYLSRYFSGYRSCMSFWQLIHLMVGKSPWQGLWFCTCSQKLVGQIFETCNSYLPCDFPRKT